LSYPASERRRTMGGGTSVGSFGPLAVLRAGCATNRSKGWVRQEAPSFAALPGGRRREARWGGAVPVASRTVPLSFVADSATNLTGPSDSRGRAGVVELCGG